jgi:hypothetical protein
MLLNNMAQSQNSPKVKCRVGFAPFTLQKIHGCRDTREPNQNFRRGKPKPGPHL